MTGMKFGSIEEREDFSPRMFHEYYVRRNIPVKVKGFLDSYGLLEKWDFQYFKMALSGISVPAKKFLEDGEIEISKWNMEEYVDAITAFEHHPDKKGIDLPPYCHDIPIFSLAQQLVKDVERLPKEYFPDWYREKWWKYAQFFMSPSGSVTPLHFDTLLTHNIFFQVYGEKEFILLPKTEEDYCYRNGWRWFQVDPTANDFEDYPVFKSAHAMRVSLGPGDLIYFPPGTLHHVTTTEASISFNVDFHTVQSIVRSFGYVFDKMPARNAYYNTIAFLGLIFKVPPEWLFRFYKSYLNYTS